MIEVSGIPYGVMGEMLQDGGNPWRGMLYGMTGRPPRVNVAPLWEFWDELGLESAKSELLAPFIENFQEANKWAPGDTVTIPKGKGYLIVVQEKE